MHLTDIEAGFIVGPHRGQFDTHRGKCRSHDKQRNLDKIVVVFLGDGAMETNAAHESMNFATVHQLPILFVCEKSVFGVLPLSIRQPAGRELCELAKSQLTLNRLWATTRYPFSTERRN